MIFLRFEKCRFFALKISVPLFWGPRKKRGDESAYWDVWLEVIVTIKLVYNLLKGLVTYLYIYIYRFDNSVTKYHGDPSKLGCVFCSFRSFQWSKGQDFQICPPHLP